jgi:hypothetical protein
MRATGSGQSPLLLLDVVAALGRSNIDYAVIGTLAGFGAEAIARLAALLEPESP